MRSLGVFPTRKTMFAAGDKIKHYAKLQNDDSVVILFMYGGHPLTIDAVTEHVGKRVVICATEIATNGINFPITFMFDTGIRYSGFEVTVTRANELNLDKKHFDIILDMFKEHEVDFIAVDGGMFRS